MDNYRDKMEAAQHRRYTVMATPHKEIFIIDALRTPFGSFLGALSDTPAPELAAAVIKDLLERTRLPPPAVNEILIGQVLQGGVGQAPARQAMRLGGLPDHIHAMTINKVCGSGLVSMLLAANSIRAEEAELVIAGGMESMSLAPYALPRARNGYRFGHATTLDLTLHDGLQDAYSGKSMGEITEDWLSTHDITRDMQDAFALRSYRLAQQALERHLFADEIVPVVRETPKGKTLVGDDEEPWRCDFEKFSLLPPVFRPDGTITAGNSSTISDGAALALLAGQRAVDTYGLQPRARLVASATSSHHPSLFPEADVDAVQKAVKKAGLTMDRIGLFEINEAFAAVALLTIEMLGIDPGRVNVNGGAVAIGHPIGASGGRLVATLLREMERREEQFGVVTLCIGGGEAVAAVLERI